MFRWFTERRRRHLLEHPFPPGWQAELERHVGQYPLLDDGERERLRQLTQVFIAEKNWEGCAGLDVTDEVRVAIAGRACLLILHRDHDLFDRLVSILVYPSAMLLPPRPRRHFDPGLTAVAAHEPILGQAIGGDVVLLAWDDVARGGHDGRNLVLHELAHIVDYRDGQVDGTPPLGSSAQARTWAEVCSAVYLAMRAAIDRDEPTFLRAYGATNEAEFFAVATETFFERPGALAAAHPELHRLLADFYGYDLATRVARSAD
jgi:Mlc titration factor MtfA (ptsG expression regulator)